MVSGHVYHMCRSSTSVSSELAKDPSASPSDIAHRLYGHDPALAVNGAPVDHKLEEEGYYDLERAFECGRWGETRPSDLFLKVCLGVT
jgi:hypothetical protein